MLDQVLNTAKESMEKGITALQSNLTKLRTGRASLVIFDGIKVDYYGTMTPLNQVASMSIPEPRMITIQPWEATMIQPIEKAIEKANLGLNPTNDGKLIRIPIPQLTEDRRKDIVKKLKGMGEDSRIIVRKSRKDANDILKKMQKDSEITEDDLRRGTESVQKLTDEYIKKIDETVAKKETDIMTV